MTPALYVGMCPAWESNHGCPAAPIPEPSPGRSVWKQYFCAELGDVASQTAGKGVTDTDPLPAKPSLMV